MSSVWLNPSLANAASMASASALERVAKPSAKAPVAETPADAEAIYDTFGGKGLTVSKKAEALLGGASFMRMCKAIAAVPSEWSLDMIDQRSTRIAELAYDRIVGWLKP